MTCALCCSCSWVIQIRRVQPAVSGRGSQGGLTAAASGWWHHVTLFFAACLVLHRGITDAQDNTDGEHMSLLARRQQAGSGGLSACACTDDTRPQLGRLQAAA